MKMENTDSQKNGEQLPVAFFLMPVDILKGVHDELAELLGADVASRVIYNCGVRSGRNIVSEMNINFPDLKTLCNTLPELWLQMGMGVFTIERLEKDNIVLKCVESNEAVALGHTGKNSCDLTSGYLAGMITMIFGREFRCQEVKCMCNGDPHCVFELTPMQ
jgi:predicted hydrocarbon binding protein